MTEPSDTHPMTAHLRQAAESIRLANHTIYGDDREVTELYDTLGALSTLLRRLPQLLTHLESRFDQADDSSYDTDCGKSADETLNYVHLALDEAFSKTTMAANALDDAWSALGHLRIHDPGD